MVAQIIKQHRARQIKELSKPLSWLGLLFSLLASLLVVAVAFACIGGYYVVTKDLPQINLLPTMLEPPHGTLLQPTRFFDRRHQQVILTLENPAAEGRQYLFIGSEGQVSGKQIAPSMVDATLVTNDPGFWNEPGYSFRGISDGSHPTLAQKLVSDLLLDGVPASRMRNIQEILLAEEVTAQYGREKVLEWYLNSARYGEFIYGVDAAARVYFAKSATKLSIAEAAMLVTLSATPQINPWSAGQLLRDREVNIIQSMLQAGKINAGQAQEALKENVHFQSQQTVHSQAPAFTDQALLQISSQFPLERLYRGGYEVTTSLNIDLQGQTLCAVEGLLDALQTTTPQVQNNQTSCIAYSHVPRLNLVNEAPQEELSAEVLILDPRSGEILAWVGGEDVNPLPGAPVVHPAGTILSPFLYLTAFSRGMSPGTMLWDLPVSNDATITNEQLATFHGPVSAREALINDYPGASAGLVEQIGVDNIWKTEKSFGITPLLVSSSSATVSDSLDSQHISLVDAVQAYGVLANHGVMAGLLNKKAGVAGSSIDLIPVTVLQLVGADGQVILDWSAIQAKPIVSEQLAYLTTNVLSDGLLRHNNQGSPDLLDINRQAGVKTAVSLDGLSTWTIGYVPQLVVGTWLGRTNGSSGSLLETSGASLWHGVMQYATLQMPRQEIVIPGGISFVQVCVPSGMLVTPLCPSRKEEVYIKGSEPTESDNLYQEFSIDRQTGLLATIFTPINLVDKRVFLILPPSGSAWAHAYGLPTPPDNYDTIQTPPPSSDQVRISSPAMFDYISGKVKIMGSAAGDDFLYYRLQVGEGLNPQQWIQVGKEIRQSVHEGFLGSWDTAGLDGSYVLSLSVVRGDQSTERVLIVVNVDDIAPQVQIISPGAGQVFTLQSEGAIILQVKASDNQSLEQVDFLVDDELVSTLYESPFIILWPAKPGLHQLLVRAIDSAGNSAEASTSFSVQK